MNGKPHVTLSRNAQGAIMRAVHNETGIALDFVPALGDPMEAVRLLAAKVFDEPEVTVDRLH